jgi:hypothetical protein
VRSTIRRWLAETTPILVAVGLAVAWVWITRVRPAPAVPVDPPRAALPIVAGRTVLEGTWEECLRQAAARVGVKLHEPDVAGFVTGPARGLDALRIELTDVPGDVLLAAAVRTAGGVYQVRDGTLQLYTDGLPLHARVYDVRDLLARREAFTRTLEPLSTPPHPDAAAAAAAVPFAAAAAAVPFDDLQLLVLQTDVNLFSAHVVGGHLWLTTDAAGHRRVRHVIELLRRERR